MSDIRAAAERLRGGFGYAHCPDHCGECKDARLLAEAYLSEHTADSETPIDEQWLRSISWGSIGRNWYSNYNEISNQPIIRWCEVDESLTVAGLFGWTILNATRGQFRLLHRALNIPLQENQTSR